jgi:hypothetical protein
VNGRGQVVLTASSDIEYAWERDDESAGGESASVFTSALIAALQDVEADSDGDGWISIDELYEHVAATVASLTPNQTPRKWSFDAQGAILLARARPRPQPLPTSGEMRPPVLADPDLRPYTRVYRTPTEYTLPVTGLETSLAYQGQPVALDGEAFLQELISHASSKGTDSFGYTHAQLCKVLEEVGVPSEPPGRHYRAHTTRVTSASDLIGQLEAGHPVVAGASIRQCWLDPVVQATGWLPGDPQSYPLLGGKTILMLGWAPDQDVFAILMAWPDWGDRGYGWMPNISRLFGDFLHDASSIEAYQVT